MSSTKKEESASTVVQPVEYEGAGGEKEVELERNFSFLSCLGLAFAMLNSWTAMSASLSLVLPSGGSISMIWGLIVSAIGTMMMTLSLAEICHILPLSGGQYDWAYILAPQKLKHGLSFLTGWNGTAGWVALVATASSCGASFIVGLISLWHPSFEPTTWHSFLIYLSFTLIACLLNLFAVRLLPLIDRVAGIWAMVGIIVTVVVCLACSSGEYQPAKNVFAKWTNETGWPDGMAFILGLLQSTFGLTAFDGVTHMVEEMPRPSLNAPKTMVLAVLLGASTSWIFIYQATSSKAGATCLLVFNLAAMLFAGQGLTTVASRLLLTFARDRGLGPLSPYLATVHSTLKVPVWCVVFVSAWVTVFGMINLGSSIALNAILSASVVFLQISYAVPIALMFVRGETAFEGRDKGHKWSLGRWRRPVNGAALVFLLVTTVTFILPPFIPVLSGTSMNWVVLVGGIVWVMCGLTWVVDGRKRFFGPSELEERLAVGKAA